MSRRPTWDEDIPVSGAVDTELPELPKLPGRLYWQLAWTGDLLGEGSVMVRIRRRGGRKHSGDTAVAAVRLDERGGTMRRHWDVGDVITVLGLLVVLVVVLL